MNIINSISEMQHAADALRREGKRIGVVPTMGYLHEGHLSLIRIAKKKSDIVITTVFVNPAQFGPNEDLSRYPRDLDRDTHLAETAGTDILFVPNEKEMYPEGYHSYVNVEKITEVLEGSFRPTHFRGVATVVAKLFNITKPHVAVFGQKDAQQAAVVRQAVKDLNFDVEIIVAPIVREPDGLAMSSRNVYLSPDERKQALALSQSLELARKRIATGERKCEVVLAEMKNHIASQPSAQIDYISIADATTLQELTRLGRGTTALVSLAVRIGSTRLIDNALITV
ncbi:MAG: pantoate--beta-alanine ligase [Bacteroidota bacterium]|jgi:pantoate--beta-alanine ligase